MSAGVVPTSPQSGLPGAGMVRTVTGDVPAADLGRTYAHEHLVLHSALIAAGFPHILLDDVDLAVDEVRACVAAGIATMVDAMPCASGRDVVRLAEIARRSGVRVIAVTGAHHERYYGAEHWTAQLEPAEIGELFAADLLLGIDAFDYTGPIVRRTLHRAGAIKVATGGPELNTRDRTLIAAAAYAHKRTGAPVLTHCEGGAGGLEQVSALSEAGVPADALMLSHVDKVTDPGYHAELASTGAWLVYDQGLRQHRDELPATAVLINHAADNGYLDQVLLGTDGARRDLWRGYGGEPGLAWLAGQFPARLRAIGLDSDQIDSLFVSNPARALAWHAGPGPAPGTGPS